MGKNKENQQDSNTREFNIEVPVRGNLGLLAYGHKGLIAWRNAKRRAIKESKEKEDGKEK